ncbi:MAG: hypothetical protein WCO56_14935 [Verrucomicrobiota bacterium]
MTDNYLSASISCEPFAGLFLQKKIGSNIFAMSGSPVFLQNHSAFRNPQSAFVYLPCPALHFSARLFFCIIGFPISSFRFQVSSFHALVPNFYAS